VIDLEGDSVSLLVVAPELVESAAANVESIGSALRAANAAAAVPTTGIAAAGADEVSAAVAALFAGHGQEFQALSAQASAFHQQFVQALSAGAGSYLAAEAANASPLQAVAAAASPLQTVAAASPLQPLLQTVQGELLNLINAPTEFLLGRPLIPTGPAVSLNGSSTGRVPLTIVGGTEPIVNASVGTGSPVPLLVDTGSTGLVIPFQNVGGVLGVLQLGFPRGIGIGGFSGGLDYLFLTYNAPVNFGGGLATSPTPVDVEFFAFPTSISSALNNGFTFQSFFAADGASGVLGVGQNAGGPGPSVATQALPGNLGQGVLINETPAFLGTGQPYLQFGPNPGTPITTLTGAPITNLEVQVGTNGPMQAVSSTIDSGGVLGTIPSSVIGNAAPGTVVQVFAPGDSKALYSFTVGEGPTVISSGLMTTGFFPFAANPIYISNLPAGVGQTVIDMPIS
jgi:PE family